MLAVCPKCEHYETCEQNYRWDSCACINYKALPTKNPTHADRIREKSDEELAEFFGTLPCCPPGEDVEELCFPLDSCEGTDFKVKCWLKWLRQEAKEEA